MSLRAPSRPPDQPTTHSLAEPQIGSTKHRPRGYEAAALNRRSVLDLRAEREVGQGGGGSRFSARAVRRLTWDAPVRASSVLCGRERGRGRAWSAATQLASRAGDVCAAAPMRARVRARLWPERAARRRSLAVGTCEQCALWARTGQWEGMECSAATGLSCWGCVCGGADPCMYACAPSVVASHSSHRNVVAAS